MYELTRETPDDRWEVEALYDLCFAPGREALSSYRLREDVARVPEFEASTKTYEVGRLGEDETIVTVV